MIHLLLQRLMEAEVAKHNGRVAECSKRLNAMSSERDGLVAEREATSKSIADVRLHFIWAPTLTDFLYPSSDNVCKIDRQRSPSLRAISGG